MQKLSEEAKKNKNAYINNYNKTKMKKIGISVNLKEYEEFYKRYNKLGKVTSQKALLFLGLETFEKNNEKK